MKENKENYISGETSFATPDGPIHLSIDVRVLTDEAHLVKIYLPKDLPKLITLLGWQTHQREQRHEGEIPMKRSGELKVNPLKADVILATEILGYRNVSHYSKEVAMALHPNTWRYWYHPENQPLRPEELLQDSQKTQLLHNTIEEMLSGLSVQRRFVLDQRYGRADGILRNFKTIAKIHPEKALPDYLRRVDNENLLTLRQSEKVNLLKSLLSRQP